MGKYDALFTPMKVGSVEIKNRIVMCPMGGTSLIEHGKFHKPSAQFYIERAKGGVGLIIPGIAGIRNFFGPGDWLDEALEASQEPVKQLMDEIHSYGTKLFMQIGLGMGRVVFAPLYDMPEQFKEHLKLDKDMSIVAPSDGIPNVWKPSVKHRGLTREEIRELIERTVKSAVLAKQAGIDGIEIHAIHEGYLLDQFSMEATNSRTDEYGGSLENRMRFVTETIRGIKEACGEDYPVIVRYSVTSKMKGFNSGALPGEPYKEFGRSMEESPAAARILEAAGCDALNADNGSYDAWYWAHPPMYMPMACNLPEVSYIKQFVNIPVFCAGRMENPDIALKAIEGGAVDGIGIARQLLADPEWPNKVQSEKLDSIRPCIACHNGCFGRLFAGGNTSCAINPAAMQEDMYKIIPAETKKKVAVVGGGIGGMEAARVCSLRGHSVTLFEKGSKLGGVFIAAAAPEFKEADKKLIDWYINQIKELSVDIKLNTEVSAKGLLAGGYDAVIFATGATAKKIQVPGIDKANVVEAIDFLLADKHDENSVLVVGGGLTGCEISYDLGRDGKKVTVIEMMGDILQVPGLSAANSNMLRELLVYHKVDVMTSTKLCEITDNGAIVERDGEKSEIQVDRVVICAGYNPVAPDTDALEGKAEVYAIGDAVKVGCLLDVVWAAYDVALKI